METTEKKEEVIVKKSVKKIGRMTFGLALIAFGIAILIQLITKQEVFKFLIQLWPVALISLGVEVLYYNAKKNIEVKYDVFGIFLMFVVLGTGVVMTFVHFGLNKWYDEVWPTIEQRQQVESMQPYSNHTT